MTRSMAHVFIVNSNTFPVHLEYQFAGTTAGLAKQRSIGLYADIARVRPGDRAYFYLLKKGFYGPFKIDPDNQGVWWDKLDPTYLQDRLKLKLIYRVRVIADGTYPLPINEWDALDRYLREPDLCLWSLVYRKLKGERGCTMIFPWEDEFLLKLIREENEKKGRKPLQYSQNDHISWNPSSCEIEVVPGLFPTYSPPSPDHISNPEDPMRQLRLISGSESNLQAFLTKNYGRFPDSELIFGKAETIRWVGNEVASGLGTQKIDLLVINDTESSQEFRVIELKKAPPDEYTVWQLERYIEWAMRFVRGADSKNIQPILLCRNLLQIPLSSRIKDSFKRFDNANLALPLKYIECIKDVDTNAIKFKQVDFNA